MSPKYTLNREDLMKVLSVLMWSGASAVVAALITLLPSIDVPTQWLFIVPIINTGLYALQKFISGKIE